MKAAPIAVSISSSGWESYTNGLLSCPVNATVDHSALLVGYTKENNWILKNSWGEEWGENGFITIDSEADCGICNQDGYQAEL